MFSFTSLRYSEFLAGFIHILLQTLQFYQLTDFCTYVLC